MPITANQLKQWAEENRHKDPSSEALKLGVESVASALQPLAESLKAQQADWNRSASEAILSTLHVDTARIRAEAEARRVAIETHALSLRHAEELGRLRRESDATARKYFWMGAMAGAALTLAGWLLSALNAGQILSHLLHL